MDRQTLVTKLSGLPLGGIRYFKSIGSTNDEALTWAGRGAPDLSIVVADEQTAGRGRLQRKWFTPRGTALAFSLILHPDNRPCLARTVGLAALAIVDSCSALGLNPGIKWPNDIILSGKKVAGILIESAWSGDEIGALIIGMGINLFKGSVPPREDLQFPATSIEDELGRRPDREEFLRGILSAFLSRLPGLGTDELLGSWEAKLVFRGEQVQVKSGGFAAPLTGELLGLDADGALRLRDELGNHMVIHTGDVSLRPRA